MPKVNIADACRLPIPIAPLQEQLLVANSIDQALGRIAAVDVAMTYRTGEIKNLDKAILAKAFRGELVPQDPNDEPASALLERIGAEREKIRPKERATRAKRRSAKLSAE